MSNVFSRLHRDIKNGTATRQEIVGFLVALFAFLSHICFFVLFAKLKVWHMFYFNIFSVTLFGILFFTFRKRESYLVTYIISTIEVIAHQICADMYIGAENGFHYYILLMVLISCLELNDHPKLSALFSTVCALVFLGIEIFLKDAVPVYVIPAKIIKILKTVNIGLTLLVIVVIECVFTRTVNLAEQIAARQYSRADRLLTNILPAHIVERLKFGSYNGTIADSYDGVSILVLDIVNFTEYSSQLDGYAVVTILNSLFTSFDEILDTYHVEKIKTHGDSYIAVAGIPKETPDSCKNIAKLSLHMMKLVDSFNKEHHSDFQVRIGIHYGPVVAGVIGKKKMTFDFWGATANFAERMNTTDIPGRIQTSREFYEKTKDDFYYDDRAPIPVKSFGMKTNYFLVSPKD